MFYTARVYNIQIHYDVWPKRQDFTCHCTSCTNIEYNHFMFQVSWVVIQMLSLWIPSAYIELITWASFICLILVVNNIRMQILVFASVRVWYHGCYKHLKTKTMCNFVCQQPKACICTSLWVKHVLKQSNIHPTLS